MARNQKDNNYLNLKQSDEEDSSHTLLFIRSEQESSKQVTLQRSLSFFDGMGVIISIMIGSGIFASPGIVLERAGSPERVLYSWIISGIIVIITALCYAELGARYPTAGGDYEYLTRAYGKQIGFSFIWYYFWISKPGSQAIIATVFSDYVLRAIYGPIYQSTTLTYFLSKFFSISLIVFLTTVNCFGIKESSFLINCLTISKLSLILFISLSAVYYSFSDTSIFHSNFSQPSSSSSPVTFFSSLIPCLWAFDGWADMNFLLEELHLTATSSSHSRSSSIYLSLLMCCSITVVMIGYLLTNLAYFTVLSADDIESSTTVGLDYGYRISPVVGIIMTGGIVLSTVGSAHGSILTGGRAFFAVARDGQAPKILAELNSRGSPYVSLLAQASWTIVLLLLPGSSYFSLLSYFGPSSWFYYALTGTSLLILPSPITSPSLLSSIALYLPPLLLATLSSLLVIDSFLSSPGYCSLAFGFIFLSLPIWWICVRLGYIEGENTTLGPPDEKVVEIGNVEADELTI